MTQTNIVSVPIRHLVFEGVLLNQQYDVLWFRQTINQIFDWKEALLHNHRPMDRGYYYRYPLIQYRSYFGKAALFAMGDGCVLIDQILDNENLPIEFLLSREQESWLHEVKLLEGFERHILFDWIPLNEENYIHWQKALSLSERVKLLESILINNIFELCKAIDFTVPNRQLEVRILDYQEKKCRPYPTTNQRVFGLQPFDLIYETNISLPPHIGLGKAKSKGFGWQLPSQVHSLKDMRSPKSIINLTKR